MEATPRPWKACGLPIGAGDSSGSERFQTRVARRKGPSSGNGRGRFNPPPRACVCFLGWCPWFRGRRWGGRKNLLRIPLARATLSAPRLCRGVPVGGRDPPALRAAFGEGLAYDSLGIEDRLARMSHLFLLPSPSFTPSPSALFLHLDHISLIAKHGLLTDLSRGTPLKVHEITTGMSQVRKSQGKRLQSQ